MDSNISNEIEHNKESLTVADVNIDFLTVIYEIIRSIEKESHDSSQKTTQAQDISQKVLELNKKLNQAREQIRCLRGIEYSKEEQLNKLESLRKQLKMKHDLLLKFRNMCSFDIPKI